MENSLCLHYVLFLKASSMHFVSSSQPFCNLKSQKNFRCTIWILWLDFHLRNFSQKASRKTIKKIANHCHKWFQFPRTSAPQHESMSCHRKPSRIFYNFPRFISAPMCIIMVDVKLSQKLLARSDDSQIEKPKLESACRSSWFHSREKLL